MSVWLCLPSARADSGTIPAWTVAGYRTAIWRDPGSPEIEADIIVHGKYPGYYMACNILMRAVLTLDKACGWCVCAGDDTLPEPIMAPDSIALSCEAHFGGTFGVMQPTGDNWSDFHAGKMSRIIERIAGSPWIGRDFARRAYGGNGPYWTGYFHCGGDEELQCVAQKLGAYWQRPDLTHYHQHWARQNQCSPKPLVPPAHLARATSQGEWAHYLQEFGSRKADGFPGSEPIL